MIVSQGRTANFENFEMCRGCDKFNVFKVARVDPARRTNFENFEVCVSPSSLKVFKVTTGPRIRHDTPCRTSPVPEPRKEQAAKNHAGCGGAGLRQPTPSRPSRSPCWFVPQQPRVHLGPLGRTASTLKTLKNHNQTAKRQSFNVKLRFGIPWAGLGSFGNVENHRGRAPAQRENVGLGSFPAG